MGCRYFHKKDKTYPPEVYRGITDDESTWGMCCSKEMAYRCAEEYWDSTHNFNLGKILLTSLLFLFCVISFILLVLVASCFLGLFALNFINPMTCVGIIILSLYLFGVVFFISRLIINLANGFIFEENIYNLYFLCVFIFSIVFAFALC